MSKTSNEDLKRLLAGKVCSTCRRCIEDECIIQAIPTPIPKEKTCEKWEPKPSIDVERELIKAVSQEITKAIEEQAYATLRS